MKVVLFGPPGVGKGTQAQLVAEKMAWNIMSMGDLLRAEIRAKSPLGEEAGDFLHRGVLVPDELILRVADDCIVENRGNGLIFDGFPRNLNQAIALAQALARQNEMVDRALGFSLPTEELVQRLTNRLYCSKCGELYNLHSRPPTQAGSCDACGGKLARRDDDREQVIRERLKVYDAETKPLIEYYTSLSVYHTVDASGTKEKVFERVMASLDVNHA